MIDIQTFKTRFCDKNHPKNFSICNYSCLFNHGRDEKRRNPILYDRSTHKKYLAYSDRYIEDFYDPNMCSNFVQYLYHPNIYKTIECKKRNIANFNSINKEVEECKHLYCPYIHKNDDLTALLPLRNLELAKKVDQDNSIKQKSNILIDLLINDEKSGSSEGIKQQISKFKQHLLKTVNQGKTLPKSEPQILPINPSNAKQQYQIQDSISNANPSDYKTIPLNAWYTPYAEFYYQQQLSLIEDRHHEFKNYKNIINKDITPTIMKYIAAFLNAQGGVLYVGIDDNSVVQGLTLNQGQFDKFQLNIDKQASSSMNPPLLPQKYFIRRIPVKNAPKGKILWILEILVPPAGLNRLMTTYNRDCYMRMNASTYKLDALNLMEWLRMGEQKKGKVQQIIQIQGYIQRHGNQVQVTELKSLKERLAHLTSKVDSLITARSP